MPGTSQQTRGLKELLDAFFAETTAKNRVTLEQYIELEKALLEQYQTYVTDELENSDDMLQNFTRMMMTSWMQIMAFQRENRTRFLELQSSIVDAQRRFLEKIGERLSDMGPDHPMGESSNGD